MADFKNVVLVVEDHAIMRMAAVSLVEYGGFVAIEAASADEAIAVLDARDDIQLVFTDVEMPGTMNGIKLAEYVRDRWPPVLLIVVSGKKTFDDADLPLGSQFFLKPYDEDSITSAMTSMLSAARISNGATETR